VSGTPVSGALAPVLLSVGPVELPVSALLILAGVAAAVAAARAGARRRGLPIRRAVDALFAMIAVGLCLGHVADVLLYRRDLLATGWRALGPASGGVCSPGAIAGAALAGWLALRRAPGGLAAHADNLIAALSLGWGIGRLGCFLDHDHLGRLTGSPLGVALPGGARHDLGLYEAALALAIFATLRWRLRLRPARPAGQSAGLAALLFAAGRFAVELLRADDLAALGRRSDARFAGLTLAQYASIALAALGATLLAATWRPRLKEGLGPGLGPRAPGLGEASRAEG